MRALDLFCGAGLAADGYARAGFEVDGVDVHPQPHFPHPFVQADALQVLWSGLPEGYDLIHASPPCQLFTRAQHLRDAQGSESSEAVDLLTPTLEVLRAKWSHKAWVVENVENAAPLMPGAVRLCGSSFGLQVQRHRLFLASFPVDSPPCDHKRFPLDPSTGKSRPWGVYHAPGDSIPKGGRTARDAAHGQEVMGVDRDVPWDALKEGVPPAYTEHVGVGVAAWLGAAA